MSLLPPLPTGTPPGSLLCEPAVGQASLTESASRGCTPKHPSPWQFFAKIWHLFSTKNIIVEHLGPFRADNSTKKKKKKLGLSSCGMWCSVCCLLSESQGNLDTVVATSDVDIKQGKAVRGTLHLNHQTRSKHACTAAAEREAAPASCPPPPGGPSVFSKPLLVFRLSA